MTRSSALHAKLWRSIRKRLLVRRSRSTKLVWELVSGKRGLEIGGPSRIFRKRGIAPIYGHAASMDGVNFAPETVWEGQLREGPFYVTESGGRPGHQYVSEAGKLSEIESGAYDFVASSHCLEHLANPIAALREWNRVTRDHASFVLVVPDHARTFDHRRPVTTLDHLVQDDERGVGEDDLTHLEEVLLLHDHDMEPVGGPAAFEARSKKNFENRCLHHHVFDCNLVEVLLRYVDLDVLSIERLPPSHIMAVASKRASDGSRSRRSASGPRSRRPPSRSPARGSCDDVGLHWGAHDETAAT